MVKPTFLAIVFGCVCASQSFAAPPAPVAPGPAASAPRIPAPALAPASAAVKPVKVAPPPVLTPEAYLAELRAAEKKIGALEDGGSRTYGNAIKLLPPPATIKRSDGESQTAVNSSLGKVFAKESGKPPKMGEAVTRREIRDLKEGVAQRRRGIEDWLRKRQGSYYQSADAKRIMAQLENTGQIRTGPTRLQQIWESVKKWFADLLEKISKWLFGGRAPRSPVKAPSIDPRILTFLFYSAVFSLLLAIVYLLWKSLGGRWRRSEAERRVRYLEGEDAELLRLPPDELRDRAARFAAAGNYREALRHLYIALLVKLDANSIWRYDTRRTNWEHIQALRSDKSKAVLVAPMSELTRRFDRVRYGDAPASRSDWDKFERDVQVVDGLVDNGQATTSAPSSGGRK